MNNKNSQGDNVSVPTESLTQAVSLEGFAQHQLSRMQVNQPQGEQTPPEPVEEVVEDEVVEGEEPTDETPLEGSDEEEVVATEGDDETNASEVERIKEVLSNIDLEQLDEDTLNQLREQLKSKAVGRFGEMTAKRKEAEAKAAQLQNEVAQLKEKLKKGPLDPDKPSPNNPYSKYETQEELKQLAEQFTETANWAEEVLEQARNADDDDVVATVQGKELTKAEVLKYQSEANKAIRKWLPEQFVNVKQKEALKAAKEANAVRLREELPWVNDEQSDLTQRLNATLQRPEIKRMVETLPEVEGDLEYILAHAVNSIHSMQSAPKKVAQPPMRATGQVKRTAAQATGRDAAKTKQAEQLRKAYRENPTFENFVALQATQI